MSNRTTSWRWALVIPMLAPFAILAAPPAPASPRPKNPLNDGEFAAHWFAGKAEVSRYRLEQARYGEIHEGEAVLIFVTEDFLPEKQVKADGTDRAATRAWPILKLNLTKRFATGIYTYSIMSSVFTPLELDAHPRSLKSTTSVQEWCGHTFLQVNLRDARYRVSGRSYFETEGDAEFDLEGVWLEDEIWTRIRIAPDTLPIGRVAMIPGGEQHRLRHLPLRVESAEASIVELGQGVRSYVVDYTESARSLRIKFEAQAPHAIHGWEEEYTHGSGAGARKLTTRATRTHTLMTDYWNHKTKADAPLREQLGLR